MSTTAGKSDVSAVAGADTQAGPEGPHAGLKHGALTLGGSVIMAIASAAPTASIALTLAAIVAVTGYASPIAILVSAIPMLGIALAYRRLNMWEVNCGGTYAWAGRAISPYFGFMVGWVIILAYFLGVVSISLPIGTYALQLFTNSSSGFAAALIDTAALIFVTSIAYVGIRAAARVQFVLIAVEYMAVGLLAVLALAAVLSGRAGSVAFEWSWFSWGELGGVSGIVSAALIAVYMFSGWDTSILVNEETEDARTNPGNAAVISVLTLAVLFAFFTFAFQGAIGPAQLEHHSENALFYMAEQLTGSWLAKWVIVAVILSGVGSALASLVSGARVTFAMGFDRVLPPIFGRTHERHGTPYTATFLGAAFALVALWLYNVGSSSAQSLFETLLSSVGLLFSLFYIATGIAMAVYYRRLALRGVRNAFEFFVFPVASAGFLLYVAWRSVPELGGWGGTEMLYLYGMLLLGVLLMLYARLRSPADYFDLPREAYDPEASVPPPIGGSSAD
ncbi:MAG: APC family permease [Actinobacteria bacterium]|nr:APC family permease [Actinomycetota bacterium]